MPRPTCRRVVTHAEGTADARYMKEHTPTPGVAIRCMTAMLSRRAANAVIRSQQVATHHADTLQCPRARPCSNEYKHAVDGRRIGNTPIPPARRPPSSQMLPHGTCRRSIGQPHKCGADESTPKYHMPRRSLIERVSRDFKHDGTDATVAPLP